MLETSGSFLSVASPQGVTFIGSLQEAANMAHHGNALAWQMKVERSPSKSTQASAALLLDLFREPDIEFDSFSIIIGCKSSDPNSTAILSKALELKEVRGGDGMKLQYLCEKLGVKLVGRSGQGSVAGSTVCFYLG